MIDNDRLHELLALARRGVPDTSRLEYAFETRLLARLREERDTSIFAWSWKLCPIFAAVAIALTLWGRLVSEPPGSPLFAEMAQEPDALGYLAGGSQ